MRSSLRRASASLCFRTTAATSRLCSRTPIPRCIYAKEEGRKNYKFFTEAMNTATSAKLSLESDLHNALRQNEFILHYQPQIDIASRKIFGVEALIRWRHPRRGLVPPLEFHTARGRTRLIIHRRMGAAQRCVQASAWHRAGLGKITVAVNMASPVSGKWI